MKYVYGPIPSRRLGKSLGIDPIPFKTCNWNCVYCQLGRTSPLINERREYIPAEEIQGLNDSEQALTDLAAVLRRVRPDEVHINLPVRPPCEPWVKPVDDEGLMRAVAMLGDVARVIQPVEGDFDATGFDNAVDALLAVITRHPMREQELVSTLKRWSPGDVGDALGKLRDSGRAQVVTRLGQRFWSGAGARYVDPELSRYHRGGEE